MAVGDEGIATGITVAFPGTIAITAQIRDINLDDMELGDVDMSHQGSSGFKRIVMQKLADPGGLELECWFKGGEDPPLGAEGLVTVTFPDTSWFKALVAVQRFGGTFPLEEGMGCTYRLRNLGSGAGTASGQSATPPEFGST